MFSLGNLDTQLNKIDISHSRMLEFTPLKCLKALFSKRAPL